MNGFAYLEVPDGDITNLKLREEAGEFDLLQPGETRTIALGTLVFVMSPHCKCRS